MKFRKKPVVIDAVQWTGTNLFEIVELESGGRPLLTCDTAREAWEHYETHVAKHGLTIKTLEGVMAASVGDWIIKGVQGECYPCKPDIFAMTYEVAE